MSEFIAHRIATEKLHDIDIGILGIEILTWLAATNFTRHAEQNSW